MHLFVEFFGRDIPSYGLMIVLGVLVANGIALLLLKKKHRDVNDFLVLEGYVFLGAFLGAKLLYLVLSFQEIAWERVFDLSYFNQLMQGGFVFYGGLMGGLLASLLAGRIHHIDSVGYMREFIFLIPLIHGFGRIGCFLAGCCYGVPYDGAGAVSFPEHSLAPSGVPLFPVQLVEAAVLFVLVGVILFFQDRGKRNYAVEQYLGLYGVARFVLEFFRWDDLRGSFGVFSTSQWISMGMVLVAVVIGGRRMAK